jgi:uncharacterized cupredoxin-like copper-binding protein
MLERWSGMRRYLLLAGGLALAFAGAAAAGIAVHSSARTARMAVTLREYRITVKRTAAVGKVTFVASNKGQIAHSLEISGPGVGKKRIVGLIAPGKSKTLTVTLKRGTYSLWCPVPGHAALGMKTSVRVGSAAGGGGTTSTTGGGAAWG